MKNWFREVLGKAIDVDKAFGLQCKDVVDSYCNSLWGKDAWIYTIRPGDARTRFTGCNPEYFTRIPQNWNDPNQIPKKGDVIVYDASPAVPEGHIAVVESATPQSVEVIQEDGYLQVPAHRATLGYILPNGAKCIGWLRPKLKKEEGDDMADADDVNELFRLYRGESPTAAQVKLYNGKITRKALRDKLKKGAKYTELEKKAKAGTLDVLSFLPSRLRVAYKAPSPEGYVEIKETLYKRKG